MERNQIQGFRVNIQANSNAFPGNFQTPSVNNIISFVSFYLIVPFVFISFVSFSLFESMPVEQGRLRLELRLGLSLVLNLGLGLNSKDYREYIKNANFVLCNT
jgi:hypothetical protein